MEKYVVIIRISADWEKKLLSILNIEQTEIFLLKLFYFYCLSTNLVGI